MYVRRWTDYCYQIEFTVDEVLELKRELREGGATLECYIEEIVENGLAGLTDDNPENGE